MSKDTLKDEQMLHAIGPRRALKTNFVGPMRKISQGKNLICILQTKFLLRLVKDGTIIHIMATKNSDVENLSTRHARTTKNTSIVSSYSPLNGRP